MKINLKKCGQLLTSRQQSILQTKPAKPFIKDLSLDCDTVELSKVAKNKIAPNRNAMITSHYDKGGTMQFGYMPENYVKVTKEFIEEQSYKIRFGPNKGKTKISPAHWEEIQEMLPHYHIDILWTGGKGTGTTAVQNVVAESLRNPLTQGRVTLDACCMDGETSPAGFYYKLGFRFKDPNMNNELATWIENGGKRENAPFLTGFMYLPKENIEHCLNYGCL